MKQIKMLALVFMVLVNIPSIYADDDKKPDARIEKLLKAEKIKYSVSSSGNYKVLFKIRDSDNRSQEVIAVSATDKYGDVEIREIWSVAAVLNDLPDPDLMLELLKTNSTIKLGAWAVEQFEDGTVWILYTAKIPADPKANMFSDIIYFVAEMADELEATITGEDVN